MAARLSRNWLAVLLIAGGLLLVVYGLVSSRSTRPAAPVALVIETAVVPIQTPEPIIPTRTPVAALTGATAATTTPTVRLTATAAPGAASPAGLPIETISPPAAIAGIATHPAPVPASLRTRFGLAAAAEDVTPALGLGLNFGSYLNWNLHANPPQPEGLQFWQMIRTSEAGHLPDLTTIAAVIGSQPGSFWIIGNEPDVPWQDNVTPQQYVELYHDLYHFIKERDPAALVVIGGVTQPTPLRLAYLDAILDSYQARYGAKMPVDVWNVHAFVLREERDSWGVGIPPGMGDDLATAYEISDHDDLAIFQQNLIDFRAWMATRGYRERPLVVTEYGILLPNDYGFPPEAIAEFMTGSFDFFLTAANDTGYPPDNNRLVQWWFWFSLYDYPDYPTSNLYDRPSGQLTYLGQVFADYVNRLLGN